MSVIFLSLRSSNGPDTNRARRGAEIRGALMRGGFSTMTVTLETAGAKPSGAASPGRFVLDAATDEDQAALDLRASRYFDGDQAFARLAASVLEHRPQAFWLDHPAFWPAVQRLRQAFPSLGDLPVIYEAMHARDPSDAPSDADAAANLTLAQDLIAAADLVIAATKPDGWTLEAAGAGRVLVLRSGIEPSESLDRPGDLEPGFDDMRFALYLGTGDDGPAEAFMDMLGDALGYLAPFERIMLSRDAFKALRTRSRFRRHLPVNTVRTLCFDADRADQVGWLVTRADVVIFPGENGADGALSMSGALPYGTPVLTHAMDLEDYEELAALDWITQADTPDAFRAAMLAALRGPRQDRPAISAEDRALLDGMRWASTLGDLVPALAKIGVLPAQA